MNRCIIYHNLNLFIDIYNTITEHNERQTHYYLLYFPRVRFFEIIYGVFKHGVILLRYFSADSVLLLLPLFSCSLLLLLQKLLTVTGL